MIHPQPAIFLDRDGTLIEEVNFLSRVEDLKIFDFSPTAIRSLKNAGYLILVVTNQSGIGRGIYDEAAMHAIHNHIQIELDGAIDAFYFCPHLPSDGCECRKPGLGMIRSGQQDFAIDVTSSWMIGDKRIDVETGQNAGMRTSMVLTGYGQIDHKTLQHPATILTANFGEAASEILKLNRSR